MLKSVVPVGARRVIRAFRFAPRAASRLASSRLSILPDPWGPALLVCDGLRIQVI